MTARKANHIGTRALIQKATAVYYFLWTLSSMPNFAHSWLVEKKADQSEAGSLWPIESYISGSCGCEEGNNLDGTELVFTFRGAARLRAKAKARSEEIKRSGTCWIGYIDAAPPRCLLLLLYPPFSTKRKVQTYPKWPWAKDSQNYLGWFLNAERNLALSEAVQWPPSARGRLLLSSNE